MELKSYKDLVAEKNNNQESIFYSDKLNTLEWKKKREFILKRDNNICTQCKAEPTEFILGKPYRNASEEEKVEMIKKHRENETVKRWFALTGKYLQSVPTMIPVKEPVILHVHHKYYIKDTLPWDYLSEALITLCHNCHQQLHDSQEVPVYLDKKMIEKMDLTLCDRCNGSGYLPEFHYHQNGICFKCNGNMFIELI